MTGLTREPCTAGTLVTAGHGFYPLCGLAGPRHPAASAVRGNRLPSVRKPIGMHGLLLAATCMLLASPLYAQSGWCPATLVPGSPAARAVLRDAEKRLADAPRPLPVVRTEGLLPGQGGREASAVARRDLPKMRTFALAWRLSADRRHLSALARYLDAWTATYRLSYSPIDETHFEAMIDAYAVAGPDLPEPTRQATAAFLRSMAAGYIERMERGRGVPRDTWTNNWQSHRVKLVSMAAAALVDERLFGAARKLYGEQLQATIRDDGSVEDFHQRDALHYVIYSLQPLARAALAARTRGEDWLGAGTDRRSLDRALRWLLPYARGEQQHQEFERSRAPFDAQRRADGTKGFSGPWDRNTAADLFWIASLLDARYQDLARSLAPAPPAWMAACWKAGGSPG